MNTPKPLFMPAPRPSARVSNDEARRLVEAASDLGFGRGSAEEAPLSAAPIAQALAPQALSPQTLAPPSKIAEPPRPAASPKPTPSALTAKKAASTPDLADNSPLRGDWFGYAPEPVPQPPRPEAVPEYCAQTLRLDIPDEAWRALKITSVHRKVTVKFLILEALVRAGYPIDLDAIPEDGRRLR